MPVKALTVSCVSQNQVFWDEEQRIRKGCSVWLMKIQEWKRGHPTPPWSTAGLCLPQNGCSTGQQAGKETCISAGPNKHQLIHSLHLLGSCFLCSWCVSPPRWMLLLVQIFFISSPWKLAGWEKFSLSQSMKHPEIRSLRQSTVIMQNPRLHPALPLCSCYCSCTISVEQILAFANRNKIRVSPKIMLQGTQETTQKR